jgi:hypothetical protein
MQCTLIGILSKVTVGEALAETEQFPILPF